MKITKPAIVCAIAIIASMSQAAFPREFASNASVNCLIDSAISLQMSSR